MDDFSDCFSLGGCAIKLYFRGSYYIREAKVAGEFSGKGFGWRPKLAPSSAGKFNILGFWPVWLIVL